MSQSGRELPLHVSDHTLTTTMMSTEPPRRRLLTRRGSASASDPYGMHADAETTRSAASRITIARVPQEQRHTQEKRSSWGTSAVNVSSPLASPGAGGRAPPGRLSFAFTSFAPITSNGPTTPPSPGTFKRSSSGHSLSSRAPTLTPQQLCDLAATTISSAANTPSAGTDSQTPFLILPDEQFLPFLERPAEVTALITSQPTSRLFALLQQTFPPHLRAAYVPPPENTTTDPPPPFGEDPSKWSFSELSRWLQTVDRSTADDRTWVSKARTCVLARSELIWSRLKGALGVPPELEGSDSEDDDDDDVFKFSDGYHDGDNDNDVFFEDEEGMGVGAYLEPIMPGDTAHCVASPVAMDHPPHGFGGKEGMDVIGEDQEEEGVSTSGAPEESSPVVDELPIRGLRISTPIVEMHPSRPVSPSISRLVRSHSTSSASASFLPGRSSAHSFARAGSDVGEGGREGSGRGEGSIRGGVGHIRARRSTQQERGSGAPLFPSSFAALGMGPSLVANNPALRTRRYSYRRHMRRLSAGWDTDGNDYALSVGSGSEGGR
ncbi:hypothetical protein BD410DRAFT_897791 [Rickenella mellea]|uniref:Uncharacterized protein n=1 Tax=Rickenella mellea TaxID=50990 RepID=A0A4Y7Q6Z5_9AGAM|nr:hypothetical protein BD410DRAFT_897791 [Rickenella mellea]